MIRSASSPTVQARQNPIVAEDSGEYGLYIGPEGGRGKMGIQCHAPKWQFLFTKDPDGTINLSSVIEYLWEQSNSFKEVREGVEAFVKEWEAFKKRKGI